MSHIRYLCFTILFLFVHQASAYTLCANYAVQGVLRTCVSVSGPGLPESEELKTGLEFSKFTVRPGRYSISASDRDFVCIYLYCPYPDGYRWEKKESSVLVTNTNNGTSTYASSGSIDLAPGARYQIRNASGGASIYVNVESAEGGYWFNSKGELTEWNCSSDVQPNGDGWVRVTVSPTCFHRLVKSYYYSGLHSSYVHRQCGVSPTGRGWEWMPQDGCYHRIVKDFY